jgi:plasmid stabilization system protein ParE
VKRPAARKLAPEVAKHFERILDHLLTHEVETAASRVRDIIAAIAVLATSPAGSG